MPPFFWPLGDGAEPGGKDRLGAPAIGHDYGTYLVVRPDGSVASTHPDGSYRTRFVNSSLRQFTASLTVCRDRHARLVGLDDVAAAAMITAWKHDLAAIDPAALDAPENWWAVIIEQLESGLV